MNNSFNSGNSVAPGSHSDSATLTFNHPPVILGNLVSNVGIVISSSSSNEVEF